MDLLKMPSDFIIQIAEVSEPCHAHQHDYLELAYIRQGWTQHTLQGESRKLTQGDFILVDDGEIHSYDIVGQNLQAINCMFRPSVIDSALGHCRKFQEVLDSCTLGMEYTKNCFLAWFVKSSATLYEEKLLQEFSIQGICVDGDSTFLR